MWHGPNASFGNIYKNEHNHGARLVPMCGKKANNMGITNFKNHK